MLRLARPAEVFGAVRSARTVVAAAYLLAPGPMLRALLDAARAGARVTVRLESTPYDDRRGVLHALNEAAVAKLRGAGADAGLVKDAQPGATRMHMKAIVCDGIAYLDDRNFTAGGDDTIVRDARRADTAAVADAVYGRQHRAVRDFWTVKARALAAETRLLRSAAGARSVDVQSESFGSSGGVYSALKTLAARGVACRLLVSRHPLDARERHTLALLERAGVDVRTGNSNAKLAVVDNRYAWAGSANSTSTFIDGSAADWGLRTASRSLAAALERRFEQHWRASKPFDSGDGSQLREGNHENWRDRCG